MMNPNSGRNSGQPNRGKKVNEFFFFSPFDFCKDNNCIFVVFVGITE